MPLCARLALLLAALVLLTTCTPVRGGRWWNDQDLLCRVERDPCFPHAVEVQHL